MPLKKRRGEALEPGSQYRSAFPTTQLVRSNFIPDTKKKVNPRGPLIISEYLYEKCKF